VTCNLQLNFRLEREPQVPLLKMAGSLNGERITLLM
jgi:hypothetical protein